MTKHMNRNSNSPLVLRAFILDTYIENPEGAVIEANGKSVLISEILKAKPEILARMIEEREKVYRTLGWGVPNAGI